MDYNSKMLHTEAEPVSESSVLVTYGSARCLLFDQFVFILLVMFPMVSIYGVFQALFFQSRVCALIFL